MIIDHDLRQFDEIWTAGGTPYAVFQLSPTELEPLTGGHFAEIKEA